MPIDSFIELKEIAWMENPFFEVKRFDICFLSKIFTLLIFRFSNKKTGSGLPGPNGYNLLISSLKTLFMPLKEIFAS